MNRWTYEIANGINFIHENEIVHKDIKAKNCLIDAHLHAKLCDFELCRGKCAGTETVELQKIPKATLTHQPPECITNFEKVKEYDTKCDIYSFGITMFEVYSPDTEAYQRSLVVQDGMLNLAVEKGVRPEIEDIVGIAPPEVISLMQRCWSANPHERPTAKQAVAEMRSVHDDFAESEATQRAIELTRFVLLPFKKSDEKGKTYAQTFHDGPYQTQGGVPKLEVNIQHGDQDNRVWKHLSVQEANHVLDLERNEIYLDDKEKLVVSKDCLNHLGKQIGPKDFKLLGSCLLFGDPELDSLHHDHSRLGIAEVNTRMLMQWRENNDTDATYKWLATACLSLNRRDLIDTIRKA